MEAAAVAGTIATAIAEAAAAAETPARAGAFRPRIIATVRDSLASLAGKAKHVFPPTLPVPARCRFSRAICISAYFGCTPHTVLKVTPIPNAALYRRDQKWLDSLFEPAELSGPEEIFPHAVRFQFSTKRLPTPHEGRGISKRLDSPFK